MALIVSSVRSAGRQLMRLVVVIPAFDEASDIARTVASVPRSVPGFTHVEVIVVDDGSSDGTGDLAAAAGADAVVRHRRNRGLAAAFRTGVDAALRRGADVIVNLDADGQYDVRDLSALVRPIVADEASFVVGVRAISELRHFSWLKRRMQRVGSWVVRLASGLSVEDATSGFRAFSADAARRISVYNGHTHTLETLIQAGRSGVDVVTVPVRVTGPTRPSRLMRSWVHYVWRSSITIVRMFVVYRPFRFFAIVSGLLAIPGALLVVRAILPAILRVDAVHVASLIPGGALLLLGVQVLTTAFLADATAANRRLLEQIRYRQGWDGGIGRRVND
jgi:glycosyltransferase involved in cell wall biosynthesis